MHKTDADLNTIAKEFNVRSLLIIEEILIYVGRIIC